MLKKIKEFSQRDIFWIFLLASINALVILHAFRAGFLMGADEFSFQYDGLFLHKTADFSWNEWINLGSYGTSINNYIPWMFFSDLFSRVFSYQSIERILYFLLYFAGSLSIFKLLTKSYGIKNFAAFLASIFYTYNVFHVMMPLTINVKLIMIAMPLAVIVIEKLISDGRILRNALLLNFVLLLIIQASSNPPAVSIVYLMILAYLIFSVVAKRISLKNSLIFSLVSAIVFILLNVWWLVILIPSMVGASSNIMENTGFATIRTSPSTSNILNGLRYMGYWAWWSGVDGNHSYVPFARAFDLNPFFIAYSFIIATLSFLVAYLVRFFSAKNKRFIMFWLIVFIFGVFISKGASDPGGSVYMFLWNKFSVFRIFRDPWAKFTPLTVISSVILSAFILDVIPRKVKYLNIILVLLLLVHLRYFAFYDSIYYNDNYGTMRTMQVDVPDYWKEYSNKMEEKRLVMRNLVYPKSPNGSNFFESGFSGPLPFVSLVSPNPLIIYPNFSNTGGYSDNIVKKLYNSDGTMDDKYYKILNVGYITQQNDYNWISGYPDTNSPSVMQSILQGNYLLEQKNQFGKFDQYLLDKIDFGRDKNDIMKNEINAELLNRSAVDVYDVKREYFTPIIFASGHNEITRRSIDVFDNIASQENNNFNSIFFKIQNKNKEVLEKIKNVSVLPTLEFKKINPTKYRVRVHGAKGEFPVVFSESFHDGWKAYLEKYPSSKPQPQSLSSYRILNGNEEDQASSDELREYVSKGYVTDLGDGKEKAIQHKKWEDGKEKDGYEEKYNIDFISKDFQGTIQNDNLPNGSIFETWFDSPIENNDNHLTANGYANSWVIDSDKLCAESKDCVKNPDGSYDFEMVVEFWPQRLFYIGLFISGITLLGCVGYLGYDWKKRKKELAGVGKESL